MTSRHDKMTAAAVWLAGHGALVGWGDVAQGKAVTRHWKDDATSDTALIPRLLGGARNSVIIPAGRLVVIDVDKWGWYEQIKAVGLPDTFTVMSPTVRRADNSKDAEPGYTGETFRGVHIYVAAPPAYDVLTIPAYFRGGETRRSERGEQNMVLGPWAMRPDGIYEPIPGTPRLIAEAPPAIFDFLRINPPMKPPKASTSGSMIVIGGAEAGDWQWDGDLYGSRHEHLRDRIREWRGIDADPDSLKRRVDAYIEKHAIPRDRPKDQGGPIDDNEVMRLIKGALDKFDDDPPESHEITATVVTASPTGPTAPTTSEDDATVETEIVIDPLSIESRIERPDPMDPHAIPIPMGLALLLDHCRPLTDAPYSSILLASAVTMSALAGTAPTLRWRGNHRPALFGVLVGASGYGRKGATMRVVEQAFTQVDPLLPEITTGGIASGEVLVDILNEAKTNTLGTVLIHEHEIAAVLISAAREGSILSMNLRKAWDGDRVDSRSRSKGKSSAFGYNAAFLGGVTPSELSKHLTANDIANGWANRFLWFWSERRDGGFDPKADATLQPMELGYLRDCISLARGLGGSKLIAPTYTMSLSDAALSRMEALATALDRPPVGSIDALRQRMPGHVVRLAMVAALMDQTDVVELDHVTFGEAMADYAVESMRAVFGVRVDDPVAVLIMRMLAQAGGWLNTTDLKKVTGKDYSRTMTALDVLLRENLIEREQRPTRGRPAIGYRLRGL